MFDSSAAPSISDFVDPLTYDGGVYFLHTIFLG